MAKILKDKVRLGEIVPDPYASNLGEIVEDQYNGSREETVDLYRQGISSAAKAKRDEEAAAEKAEVERQAAQAKADEEAKFSNRAIKAVRQGIQSFSGNGSVMQGKDGAAAVPDAFAAGGLERAVPALANKRIAENNAADNVGGAPIRADYVAKQADQIASLPQDLQAEALAKPGVTGIANKAALGMGTDVLSDAQDQTIEAAANGDKATRKQLFGASVDEATEIDTGRNLLVEAQRQLDQGNSNALTDYWNDWSIGTMSAAKGAAGLVDMAYEFSPSKLGTKAIDAMLGTDLNAALGEGEFTKLLAPALNRRQQDLTNRYTEGRADQVTERNKVFTDSEINGIGLALFGDGDVSDAWEKADLVQIGKFYSENPTAAVADLVTSLPSVILGGGYSRASAAILARIGVKVPVTVGAAAGEGAVIAGGVTSAALEGGADGLDAAVAGLGAGVAGGLVGIAGARLAGGADLDVLAAGGAAARGAATTGLGRAGEILGRPILGAGIEAGEEALQTGFETTATNAATGKPLGEGLGRAVVEGAVAGGGQGFAANAYSSVVGAQQFESTRRQINLTLNQDRQTRLSDGELKGMRQVAAQLEAAQPGVVDIGKIDAEIQRRVGLGTLTRAAEQAARLATANNTTADPTLPVDQAAMPAPVGTISAAAADAASGASPIARQMNPVEVVDPATGAIGQGTPNTITGELDDIVLPEQTEVEEQEPRKFDTDLAAIETGANNDLYNQIDRAELTAVNEERAQQGLQPVSPAEYFEQSGQQGFELVDADESTLSIPTVARLGVQLVAKAFGKKVRYIQDRNGKELFFSGVYGSSIGADENTIFLDAKGGMNLVRVVGHEIGHALRTQAPDLYDILEAEVLPLLDQGTAVNELVGTGYGSVEGITDDMANRGSLSREEVIGNLIGDKMVSPKFWMDLAAKMTTEKAQEFFTRAFEVLDKALRAVRSAPLSGQDKKVVKAAHSAIVEAMSAYRQRIVSGEIQGADTQVEQTLAKNETTGEAKFAKKQVREKVGQFEATADKTGAITVYGDPAAIRAALPENAKGRDTKEGIVFTATASAGVRAALDGRKNANSRAGEIQTKKPMKDGKLLGAPDKFNSLLKLPRLRKMLNALAIEGAPGRYWYENSSKEILRMVGGDVNEARKFVALLAIYSPQAKVDTNTTFALRAWAQYKAGQPISVKTGVMDGKAKDALDSIDDYWSGEKTGNFFNNLLREIDPTTSETQGATIDMWMMRAGHYATDAPTATQYAFMEDETNRLAKDLGWEPQQVQAAIWVAMKARMENKGVKERTEASSEKKGWIRFERDDKGKRRVILDTQKHRDNWLREAFAHDPSKQDTKQAKFDFSDGVLRHIGQVSFEARPGRTSGVLPGIHAAPYAQQVEFHQAVQKAFYDERGNDLLAMRLGLLVDNDLLAPGVWQGEVSPSSQKSIAMAPAKGPDGKTKVDPAQAKALNTYAAILGLLTKQEGVGWHRPFYQANKGDANGLDFDIGRTVTVEEAQAVEAAVGKWMQENNKGADWGKGLAFISSPTGIRLVNFGVVSNTELLTAVRLAAAEALPDNQVDWFTSDGDMPTNDWKEYPNGQEYIERASAKGSPDVLGWSRDFLGPRVQQVFDDFSAKYEWGNPGQIRFSRNRSAEGRPSGNRSVSEAQSSAADVQASEKDLIGLPNSPIELPDGAWLVPSAVAQAREVARKYMRSRGLKYTPSTQYAVVDKARAKQIAEAFEAMPHNPTDPTTVAAYKAMIGEVTAQYRAVLATGLKVEFIDFDQTGDPYPNPRMLAADILDNNHFYVFSTKDGFGSSDLDVSDNPLLAETSFKDVNGKPMLANDLFRVVHDYFGHFKDGVGFRANGEENAWRSHAAMFTPLARRALTTETRGQNSWVNYGKFGDANRTASAENTVFADQKIGLLPEWVSELDGVAPADVKFSRKQTDTPEFKKWFGDSKIVDRNGEPLEVYHGTAAEFTAFDDGAFFTDDYMNADGYAGGETVIAAFLKMERPLVINARGRKWDNLSSKFGGSTREIVGVLDTAKYDGVIFNNIKDSWIDDSEHQDAGTVYFVARAGQVKSTTDNNGNFDAANPDIRFSRKPTSQLVMLNEIAKNKTGWGKYLDSKHTVKQGGETKEMGQSLNTAYLEAAKQKDTFDAIVKELAEKAGVEFSVASLKKRERAVEKIIDDYNGSADKIKDLLRATISTESFTQARQIYEALAEVAPLANVSGNNKSDLDAGKPASNPAGYRDAKLILDINGVPAELIITADAMLRAKDIGHAIYDESRTLPAKIEAAQKAGNLKQVTALKAEVAKLNAKMVEVYLPAFERASSSRASLREMGTPFSSIVRKLIGRLSGSNTQNPVTSLTATESSKSKNLASGPNSANKSVIAGASESSIIPQGKVTESEAFKNWFGNSKVTNAAGEPLIIYHGTENNFEAFEPSKKGLVGPGIYFTTNEDEAKKSYSGEAGRVLPVYLKAEKILRASKASAVPLDWDETYDAVLLRRDGADWYVVKSANQIKSAVDNNGDFDSANAKLRFSRKPFEPSQHENFSKAIDKLDAAHKSGVTSGMGVYVPVSAMPKVFASIKAFRGRSHIVGKGSSIYLKAIDQHQDSSHNAAIPLEILRKLPEYLADPIAIYDKGAFDKANPKAARSDEQLYLVVLPAVVKGEYVTVAITPDGKIEKDSVGFIKSVHTRSAKTLNRYVKYQVYEGVTDRQKNEDSGLRDMPLESSPLIPLSGDTDVPALGTDVTIRPSKGIDKVKTRNDIKFSRKQEGTPEFKKWFGDSKVVDAEGNPLVVYHGSRAAKDFDVFKIPKRGAYFTDSLEAAESYGEVKAVYLALANPLVIDLNGESDMDNGFNIEREARYANSEGFDGLIVKNSFDGENYLDQYVVFNPSQIKSATDNNGAFDSSNVGLRFKRKPANQTGSALALNDETAGGAVVRNWQNDQVRWKDQLEALRERGGVVNDQNDVYQAMERMVARAMYRTEDFFDKHVTPVLTQMRDADVTLEEIGDYLYAMHAKERNAEMKKINPQFAKAGYADVGGSGMSDQEADQIVAKVKASPKAADMDRFAQGFRSWTQSNLASLVQGGLMSQQQANDLQTLYPNYVPLKGYADGSEVDGIFGSGSGFSTGKKLFQRALGRKSKANNPAVYIIHSVAEGMLAREKANVGRYLERLIKQNPDDKLWTIGQPEKDQVLGKTPIRYEIFYKGIAGGSFQYEAQAKQYIKLMNLTGATVQKSGGEDVVIERDMGFDVEREIRFIRDGKEVRIQLKDPLLARAYNNQGMEQMHSLLKVSAAINGFLRQMWTQKNPVFPIVNVVRDIPSSILYATGEKGFTFAMSMASNYPKAFKAAWQVAGKKPVTGAMASTIKEYRAAGGGVGFRMISDTESTINKVNALQARLGQRTIMQAIINGEIKQAGKRLLWRTYNNAVIDMIEQINATFENMSRIAIFAAARERGMSAAEAARMSKNVTVNFNRRGEQGPNANALFLFMNAAVQGLAKDARSVGVAPNKNQARAVLAAYVGLGFAIAAMAGDDEDDLTQENANVTSVRIRVGDAQTNIPLPYGSLGFSYYLGRSIYKMMSGDAKVADQSMRLASAMLGHMSPINPVPNADNPTLADVALSVVPTPLELPAMVVLNRNSFGSTMRPDYSATQPDAYKAFRGTRNSVYSELTAFMNEGTGGTTRESGLVDVSPETLKGLVHFALGGTGKFVGDAASTGSDLLSGEVTLNKIPVVNRFVKMEDVTTYRARFYNEAGEAKDKLTLLNGYRKDRNQDKFKELAPWQQLGRRGNSLWDRMNALRDQEALVNSDDKLSAKEKTLQLKTLEDQQIKISNDYHAMYKEKAPQD